MPPEHNQQHSRRPHYHRGRRGPDRRGGDRRPQQSQQQQTETSGRDQLDIEQIMREIRSRISERQGVDLTAQQIQELAARRLEAILDPRAIKPSLMDELRRAAGLPADTASPEPEGEPSFDESALYKTDNGFLRFVRRLLNPLLKLFFNPTAVVEALNAQSQRAKAVAAREAEQRRRQTEWNALHFEVLRRLVTDIARVEIDNQHLAHRVESLTARVDFNERRVRGIEHTQQHQPQSRPSGRPEPPVVSSPAIVAAPREAPREENPAATEPASSEASTEGSRRRRRRRRGRRSGQPREIGGVPAAGLTGTLPVDQGAEGDDFGDDDATSEELTEESEVSVISDQPTVPEFEPPAPRQEEALPISAADLERVPLAPDSAPAPAIEESVEPDPVPPERS
jgi:hypothetical protein